MHLGACRRTNRLRVINPPPPQHRRRRRRRRRRRHTRARHACLPPPTHEHAHAQQKHNAPARPPAATARHGRHGTPGSRDPSSYGVDFLLLANMWSLLNHEAFTAGILDRCAAEGVSVVVGGPYSSGILATGADPASGTAPFYNYAPAAPQVRERCRRIEAICRKVGPCCVVSMDTRACVHVRAVFVPAQVLNSRNNRTSGRTHIVHTTRPTRAHSLQNRCICHLIRTTTTPQNLETARVDVSYSTYASI